MAELLSLNKTYSNNGNAYTTYPDTGGVEFTDGNIGGSGRHTDAKYSFWTGLASVIDLGALKSIENVRFHYCSDSANGYLCPLTLVVAGSKDNVSFTNIGSFVKGTDWIDYGAGTGYGWSNSLAVTIGNYRYVKFTFVENGAWMAFSELEVYGSNAKLAGGVAIGSPMIF